MKAIKDVDQIIRDRYIAAAGMYFVSRYEPPEVALPDGVPVVDAAECRARHLAEYELYDRNYIHQREGATRKTLRAFDRFVQFITAERARDGMYTTFLNVAALQAVAYFLGGAPAWCRQVTPTLITKVPTGPPPDEAWPHGVFVLGLRLQNFGRVDSYGYWRSGRRTSSSPWTSPTTRGARPGSRCPPPQVRGRPCWLRVPSWRYAVSRSGSV